VWPEQSVAEGGLKEGGERKITQSVIEVPKTYTMVVFAGEGRGGVLIFVREKGRGPRKTRHTTHDQ